MTPSQFPPSQPYYAPPGPPPRKVNSLLIVAIVVVAAVVLLPLAFVLSAPPMSDAITVMDVSFTIGYSDTNHFFGPSPLTTCGTCPIYTTPVHQFQYAFALHNHDAVAHTVTEVTVSFPFGLVSVTPDPALAPVSVPATGSVTFTLVIESAMWGGSYTLAGTIGVT